MLSEDVLRRAKHPESKHPYRVWNFYENRTQRDRILRLVRLARARQNDDFDLSPSNRTAEILDAAAILGGTAIYRRGSIRFDVGL